MSRMGEVAAPYQAEKKRELTLAWLARPAALRTVSVLVLLGVWEIAGRHTLNLSYPTAVARAAYHTFSPDVLPAFGDTMSSFWFGYAICIAVGIPIGLLMARSRLAELSLWPYVSALYATPRLALIPVLILWLGITYEMRVSVVVISGVFPIILNTFLGGKEVDKNLIDAGVAFNAGRLQILRTVVIPGSLHFIFAGLRIALGRALIGTIVAEIEASVVGIGNLISRDAQVLAMDRMFVPIILLGFFSLACSTFLKFGERWATMPWTRATRRLAWPSSR
jgi:NitT/TauT family transport system permease protein